MIGAAGKFPEAGVAEGLLVAWGVERAGKFGFAACILAPPPSFSPQEDRITTLKTDTANAIYFMEYTLTPVKIHNYLNKAK